MRNTWEPRVVASRASIRKRSPPVITSASQRPRLALSRATRVLPRWNRERARARMVLEGELRVFPDQGEESRRRGGLRLRAQRFSVLGREEAVMQALVSTIRPPKDLTIKLLLGACALAGALLVPVSSGHAQGYEHYYYQPAPPPPPPVVIVPAPPPYPRHWTHRARRWRRHWMRHHAPQHRHHHHHHHHRHHHH